MRLTFYITDNEKALDLYTRICNMKYLPETDQMLTNSEFDEYCKNMAETKAWGGQIELRAISDILGRKIEVLQAEGPPVIIGENLDNETASIILTYHKHYLGLGEHYNSTKVRVLSEDEKDE